MPTIASVIIPAYNEEKTIGRCLDGILKDCHDGELEIIVVCNGCLDNTFNVAKRFESRGVKVIDTRTPSKCNALNLGDQNATLFPRVYLDADIQIGIETLRSLVHFMNTHPDVLLSAPRATVDYSKSDALVRAYYRVWTELPYFKENMVGSGIYAFSAAGRARFDQFPEIISDDEFARRAVTVDERKSASEGCFTISAPRNIASLLAVNTRVRAGMYQLEERFPDTTSNRGTNPLRTVREIAKNPRLWLDAPIYLGVMFAAKMRAHKKLQSESKMHWNRDESARS